MNYKELIEGMVVTVSEKNKYRNQTSAYAGMTGIVHDVDDKGFWLKTETSWLMVPMYKPYYIVLNGKEVKLTSTVVDERKKAVRKHIFLFSLTVIPAFICGVIGLLLVIPESIIYGLIYPNYVLPKDKASIDIMPVSSFFWGIYEKWFKKYVI